MQRRRDMSCTVSTWEITIACTQRFWRKGERMPVSFWCANSIIENTFSTPLANSDAASSETDGYQVSRGDAESGRVSRWLELRGSALISPSAA